MRRTIGSLVLLMLLLAAAATTAPAQQRVASSDGAIVKQRITFKSGALTLVGFLFKPAGHGPFPGIIWNHGSEKNPGTGVQFDSVGAIFGRAGYVVFAPMRRGHGFSEGPYIADSTVAVRSANGALAAQKFVVDQLSGPQLDDQLAGLAFLKSLAYVDTTRLVVAGCSYGGIQTLLGAERGAGYRAAIAVSPGALSWAGSPLLQERLKIAASRIAIPTFLIQPPKDPSLEPARVLGPILTRKSSANKATIYPAEGPEEEQGHCFGGASGMHHWTGAAIDFLKQVLH